MNRTERITFLVSKEKKEALLKIAETKGVNLSSLLNIMVSDLIEENK